MFVHLETKQLRLHTEVDDVKQYKTVLRPPPLTQGQFLSLVVKGLPSHMSI